MMRRWIAFNGVGALGVVVQLAALAILVRGLNVPYLWATAAAVECAVLHNFALHQRCTWRDRPADSRTAVLTRLLRFHALNGAVSVAGNVLVAALLTGGLGFDPLASNAAAILSIGMINFAASERLVFRRAAVARLLLLAVMSPAAAAASPGPEAGIEELRPATLQAWTAYERQVDARLAAASADAAPFFALDAYGVKGWRDAALKGGIAMHQLERPLPAGARVEIPDGKAHHWTGAIFVPGTTVARVLDHLSRFAGRESEHYEDVVASRLLSREGDAYRIFLKLRRTKFQITSTYHSEHAVVYRRLGSARATARSVSTRIAELRNAGTAQERELPEGKDSGYLWRLNAYWRYEQVDGGVLIECESISLSRSVPVLVRFLISGIVEGIARESLEKTLGGLKRALAPAAASSRGTTRRSPALI